MDSKKTNANQITEGVIWKQLLAFFFPIVLGTFFQQLYNTADTVVVGRFVGKQALAAVGGSTAQLVNLIVGFFVGLASGATVVISQFYGARDKTQVSRALHTAYAFSCAGSVVISILGYALAPALLRLMNTPEEVMADSTTYLRIYFIGILFVFIYNVGSGILRAVGDSKRPLYVLIVCCVLNIVLDIILVLGLQMGVAGVAIATIFSQGVSAVMVTFFLMKSNEMYQLSLKEIRFYKAAFLALITIGFPSGLQSVSYSFTNTMIQATLNTFGTDTIAAWTAFGKIDSLFWMIIGAFGISITTFVGQNFGAGKYDRMKKSVKIGIGMAIGTSLAITILFLTVGEFLFALFTDDANVIAIGMEMLRQMAPAYVLFVFIELLSGALRGMGDVLIPTIMTLCGVCLLRLIWIIFVFPINPTLHTLVASYPITWAVTATLFIVYYMWKIRKY